MLVQGVLFAGLTMVITARTSYSKLASSTALTLLLVELPAWIRKCSVCLAILSERWGDDLLPKLDAQFELLADNTLRTISAGLTTSASDNSITNRTETPDTSFQQSQEVNWSSNGVGRAPFDFVPTNPSAILDSGMAYEWDDVDLFNELLEINGSQTFWDIFPQGAAVGNSTQPWQQGPLQ
jgi:hypothetical protein